MSARDIKDGIIYLILAIAIFVWLIYTYFIIVAIIAAVAILIIAWIRLPHYRRIIGIVCLVISAIFVIWICLLAFFPSTQLPTQGRSPTDYPTVASTSPESQFNPTGGCSITGNWRVSGQSAYYVVSPDGTVELRFDTGVASKSRVLWARDQGNKYTFYWTHSPSPGQPKYVDTVYISSDCQKIDITNNFGQSAIAIQLVNSPASQTQSQTTCDIVGRWTQTEADGKPVTNVYIQIYPDNRIEIYLNNQLHNWGTWEKLTPNTIRSTWTGTATGTDTITISPDCRSLAVLSHRGEHATFVRG